MPNLKRITGRIGRPIATVVALVLGGMDTGAASGSSSQARTLSGLIEFGTDSNGVYVTTDENTVGGDVAFNLYLAAGGRTGAFINSGDGASTSVSIPLSPGSYTYAMFGEGGASPVSYFGLSLFFDGSTTAPSITAFAPFSESTTPQAYLPDAQSTPFLGPFTSMTPTLVNGAGTTSFTDGTELISLTSYFWADQPVYNLDRVSAFTSNPNGVNDFVGQFTLNVTVPEPTSFSILAVVSLGLLSRRRVT